MSDTPTVLATTRNIEGSSEFTGPIAKDRDSRRNLVVIISFLGALGNLFLSITFLFPSDWIVKKVWSYTALGVSIVGFFAAVYPLLYKEK